MKKLTQGIHFAFACLLLVTSAWPRLVTPAVEAAAPDVQGATPDLQGFQPVTPTAGWVLLDQRLYWTDAGGPPWTDITPAGVGADAISAVHFLDSQMGWLVATGGDETASPTYQLFRTTDGGASWQSNALDLFAPGDVSALASAVFIDFVDSNTGWLVVKQATSKAFNVGTLFGTTDGGATWTRLSIPAGVPVHFTSAQDGWLDTGPPENLQYATLDGGATWSPQPIETPAAPADSTLSELSMVTAEAGWARSAAGACDADGCALTVQLMATSDGGQTWTAVTLPSGQTKLVKTFPVPATAAAVDAPDSATSLVLNHAGQGFDACTLPPVDNMAKWYTDSPYKVWNLYIGGGSVANCGQLTAGYLQQLAQQGWLFIPTWVGPQPPCSNVGSRKFSADLATAYQQGVMEAYLALDRTETLRLRRPGSAGTIIYYDIENYPNQAACREAAKSFISGWTATLHAHGSQAGVYGSPCSSYVPDLAGIANVPDAVWLAVWKLPAQYDPNASVENLNCISNSLWNQNQRLRQYAGDHQESYGGVGLNIDSNVIAGPVATVSDACTPGAGQVAVFVYAQFGGRCVVRGAGDYGNHGALGVGGDTISSVRLGSNVKIEVCQHENYSGTCQVITSSDTFLGNDAIGDNQVSSYKVSAHSPAGLTVRYRLPMMNLGTNQTVALPNGGFESGPAGWNTFSARGNSVIVPGNVLAAGSVTPHAGSWGVWMGGVHTETVTLQQTVGIPSETPTLTYWHWIKSAETGCYYDVASIWVNNTVVESYGLCTGSVTNGWVKQTVNLSAYAGSTVALRFQVTTDTSDLSSLFLEDVGLQSGP